MTNITPMPLATLIATAQDQETAARRMPASVHFSKRCVTAFPTLFRHPQIRASRDVLAALHQWTFALGKVQFLAQWTGGRGGYWKFWAWSDSVCIAAADTGSYDTHCAETALLCFVGAALTKAEAAMLVGETMYVEAVA